MKIGVVVSEETLKVAQEAIHMVYDANIAWLQIRGQEGRYLDAMDEISAKLTGAGFPDGADLNEVGGAEVWEEKNPALEEEE